MTLSSKLYRFWTFVKQAVFWTPLSLLINVCAAGPIYYLYVAINGGDGMPLENLIFIWPMFWAVAFGLNKFRQAIKGRKTDDYYTAYYDEVTSYYLGDRYIGETHRDVSRTEHSNTFWGMVGIVLSFIAFPLQLVALTASFLSLFFPVIYCTTRRLPIDRDFSLGNIILHTLFEFVIIPVSIEKRSRASAKGFLWIPFFISIPLVDLLVFGTVASAIGPVYDLEIVGTLAIIAFLFTLLSIVIMIIKYSALIIYSFSKWEVLTYGAKIGRVSILAGVLLITSLMFL